MKKFAPISNPAFDEALRAQTREEISAAVDKLNEQEMKVLQIVATLRDAGLNPEESLEVLKQAKAMLDHPELQTLTDKSTKQ